MLTMIAIAIVGLGALAVILLTRGILTLIRWEDWEYRVWKNQRTIVHNWRGKIN